MAGTVVSLTLSLGEREKPTPGLCLAHTGLANSVAGMAKRRRTILPLPEGGLRCVLGCSADFQSAVSPTCSRNGRRLKAAEPREGRHICRTSPPRQSQAPSGATSCRTLHERQGVHKDEYAASTGLEVFRALFHKDSAPDGAIDRRVRSSPPN